MENIRLAFQGIWGHKMRSFLTMLGIIIGIASIITIVSTIKGTNEQIKQNLIGAGNNVVTVQLYQSGSESPYDMSWNPVPEGVRTMEEGTRSELVSWTAWRRFPSTGPGAMQSRCIIRTPPLAVRFTALTGHISPCRDTS